MSSQTQPMSTQQRVQKLLGGASFADTLGMAEGELDAIYNLAYHQYNGGDYQSAERSFGVLCMLDHRAERAWMGLGASRQRQQSYGGAALAYAMVANSGHKNPFSALHAAECYLALGMFDEALSGTKAALDWAEEHPQPEQVRNHAAVLYAAIESQRNAAGQQGAVS